MNKRGYPEKTLAQEPLIFKKNKRGQFYLLAAIIIIAAIIGFASVSNYVVSKGSTRIYDLKDELSIEAEEVLNFGILNSNDPDFNYEALIESFTRAFDQRAEGEKVYFIFGNSNDVEAYVYEEESEGTVSLNIGAGTPAITIINKAKQDINPQKSNGKVQISIDGQDYEFDLNPGENFYFIIKTQENGDTNVVNS